MPAPQRQLGWSLPKPPRQASQAVHPQAGHSELPSRLATQRSSPGHSTELAFLLPSAPAPRQHLWSDGRTVWARPAGHGHRSAYRFTIYL